MISRFALLRALVRPALLPTYSTSSGSNPSELTSAKHDAGKLFLTKCLVEHGIPSDASEEIVSQLPTQHVDEEEVQRTMNSLASLQFGEERLLHLLKTHPGLVLANSTRITKCYINLSSIFTQNYVYKILFNAPNVVDQKRSEVADKINFLNNELGVPNAQIVNSSALSYPISHLKVRSEFLRRCGVLKPPPKKRDAVLTIVDLGDMFDTTDVKFATKVAKLTPIEFDAFSNLYNLEDDSDVMDSDSDSD